MSHADDNIRDALDHAEDVLGLEGKTIDVQVGPLKLMKLADVLGYEDAVGWLELDPADFRGLDPQEIFEELKAYRGADFARRAMEWVRAGAIPAEHPVVLLDGDFGPLIGDGRGRINVARALKMPKLWTLTLTLTERKRKSPAHAALKDQT